MLSRYSQTLERYKPPGIRFKWKRARWREDVAGAWHHCPPRLKPAHASLRKREIYCAPVKCLDSLAFAIHECGHFWLRHFDLDELPDEMPRSFRALYTGNTKQTVAEMEYECERWTIAVLRLEGFHVDRVLLGEMRNYVAECIDDDTAKKRSPRHVRRWVR